MDDYISARELFLKNRRFDLIYKILFLEHINSTKETFEYYRNLYLKSIEVFNGFYEKEPPKNSAQDFINSFEETYNSIKKNGFNIDFAIPVSKEGHLYDGAHRLSIAYLLNIDVPIKIIDEKNETDTRHTKKSIPIEYAFDYHFFKKRGISTELADIGALEYVKRNKKAHIVQLSPIISSRFDAEVETILNKYGFVYYKKDLRLNYNAIVRVKQINYGNETWAGDYTNKYRGLKKHAQKTIGLWKTRIFVFVCDSLDKTREAKNEIRALFNYGNHPIHINDTHQEAIALANIFFNRNAVDLIKSTSYMYDNRISYYSNLLKEYEKIYNIDLNSFCVSSSSVLSIYGLRKAADIDCLSLDDKVVKYKGISSHTSEKKHYPHSFEIIITDHRYHLVVGQIKFASLKIIKKLKAHRHEFPKDYKDLLLCLTKNIHLFYYDLCSFVYYAPKSHIKWLISRTKNTIRK